MLDPLSLSLNPLAGSRRRRYGLFLSPGEVEDFQAALSAGDPHAIATYQRYQRDVFADVRQEDLQPWPDAIADGETVTVPASAPLYGYRFWGVRGSTLVAPYMTAKTGLPRKAPGVEWRPGINKSVSRYCDAPGRTHPHPDCHCGIRAMQARSALEAFARAATPHFGAPGAIAKVAVWGVVTGGRDDDDDWIYTLRASHARIAGPIDLAPEHEPRRAAIEHKYRIASGGQTLALD